jgi:hypothetical protein
VVLRSGLTVALLLGAISASACTRDDSSETRTPCASSLRLNDGYIRAKYTPVGDTDGEGVFAVVSTDERALPESLNDLPFTVPTGLTMDTAGTHDATATPRSGCSGFFAVSIASSR